MERFRGGTIGMDVDRGAIKAVQVSKAADGYVLQHVGYHRLPEGAIIDGEVADSEMLAKEIKEFWDLHSFKGKSVILGVAGRNVIVRFVTFPRLSPEDLASAMGFQAEEHIPMPLEDAVLDYIVLGPSTENPEEDNVLVVAAHRAMISGYTAAARSGGLKPAGIDVKALSLMRSTLPDVLFDNEETVLLLDIGTEISNLVVVQSGRPTLTQFIPLGFRDFSQAVAEAADIEADLAEKQALNPRASIGSILDEPEENNETTVESSSEAETLALDSIQPQHEGQHPTDAEQEEEQEATEDSQTFSPREDAADRPEETPETGDPENVEPEGKEPRRTESESEDESRSSEPDGERDERDEGASEDGDDAEATIEAETESDAQAEDEAGVSSDEARTEELSSDPALMYDVRRGLEDAARRLAEEVQRSVEYHDSRPDAREVSRVLISGEGALVRGLDGYLADLLGVATERARPAGKLSANRSNVSDEQFGAMEPVLAIALGLAMEDE